VTITIRITPTLFIAGGGKFRSDRRYLRAGASGSRFPIVQGATMAVGTAIGLGHNSGSDQEMPTVRWSVGGVVRQQTLVYFRASGTPPVDSGTFNAATTLVKI
jgi:hypothetical protein